ncbi:MAG: GNAT family N-acetyltransferase [Acidilobus sp.]
MVLRIERLRRAEDLRKAVEVQVSAWGMDPASCEAVPVHMLKALVENGGLVLGAFDDDRLIGFSAGWFVLSPEGPYFYSHMTGVVEDRKYGGVGLELKLAQRREVLASGVRLIKWTFDPLQSLNANFNLNKLGALFRRYARGYYGEIRDSINAGLEADRAVAEWHLDSRNVELKIDGILRTPPAEELVRLGAHVAVSPEGPREQERPLGPDVSRSPGIVLVGLPYRVSSIVKASPGLAGAWREATRAAYESYLAEGYIASDFTWDSEGHGYVVMIREPLAEVLDGVRPWS